MKGKVEVSKRKLFAAFLGIALICIISTSTLVYVSGQGGGGYILLSGSDSIFSGNLNVGGTVNASSFQFNNGTTLGATGPAGISGTNGTNGSNGSNGTNGTNGSNGAAGINGNNGLMTCTYLIDTFTNATNTYYRAIRGNDSFVEWSSTNWVTVFNNVQASCSLGGKVVLGLGYFNGAISINYPIILEGSGNVENDTATSPSINNGTVINGTVTTTVPSIVVSHFLIQGTLNLTKNTQGLVATDLTVTSNIEALGVYVDKNVAINDWNAPFSNSFRDCLFFSTGSTTLHFFSDYTSARGGHVYFDNCRVFGSGSNNDIIKIQGYWSDIILTKSFLYPLRTSGTQNIITIIPPNAQTITSIYNLELDSCLYEFLYPTVTNVINFGDNSTTKATININGGTFDEGTPNNMISDGTSDNPQYRAVNFNSVTFSAGVTQLNFNQTSNTPSQVLFNKCIYQYSDATHNGYLASIQNNASTATPASVSDIVASVVPTIGFWTWNTNTPSSLGSITDLNATTSSTVACATDAANNYGYLGSIGLYLLGGVHNQITVKVYGTFGANVSTSIMAYCIPNDGSGLFGVNGVTIPISTTNTTITLGPFAASNVQSITVAFQNWGSTNVKFYATIKEITVADDLTQS